MNQTDNQLDKLKLSTIMLVDDEPVMLDIVQALLEEEGYQNFIPVQQSASAIDILEEKNPDMMLLDLDMPEVDGFQVLKAVRSNDRYQYLPVIILTASEDPENKLRALELGATDFLSKPVDPSELALRVRNTLSAKAYQDQLAYYDSLTGLPNRKLFIERLEWGMRLAKRENRPLALLNIGLDRFRNINETFGISVGDHIIRTVAERLCQVARASDIVGQSETSMRMKNMARIAGDEFSIVLCDINNIDNASVVCERVLKAINEVFLVDGRELYITASIGIAIFPEDGSDVESLIKHAASARDHAKKQGVGNFVYYSKEMNAHAREMIQMESDLRRALVNNEFELHYQPKIDLISGDLMGMESLIRWRRNDGALVPPGTFIPLAEEMDLIVPIGNWVLHEACRKTSEWVASGYTDIKVSVNVSARQFIDSGFKASVESALKESQLNPKNLVLEITESMLMGDVDHYVSLLNDITELGVAFSLDDFGTGYSSLSYLKRFPINELKIDRSFLIDVPNNADDCSIVKAIISMAHSLGLKVVAEGVEEDQQLEFLRQHECEVIQGYYFSKPLNTTDFSNYLNTVR